MHETSKKESIDSYLHDSNSIFLAAAINTEKVFGRTAVNAHRNEKGRQHMSRFENFITEGSGKADELTKGGAMLDGV